MTAGMSKKEQIKLVAKRKAFGPKGPQGKKMKKPRAQAASSMGSLEECGCEEGIGRRPILGAGSPRPLSSETSLWH